MRERNRYREHLIQWVWKNLEFDFKNLNTVCGKRVRIINRGTLNQSEGPDFLNSHLVIDGMEWHGSVEIHLESGEWFSHGHHLDENYNRVVLHLIFEGNDNPAITSDGFHPYTVELKPYLRRPLHKLLDSKQGTTIPCGGILEADSDPAFIRQIQKADTDYFNYKIEELLRRYDPGKPASSAWKRCLLFGIYDAMGIPNNREQMAELAEDVIGSELIGTVKDIHTFAEEVVKRAGIKRAEDEPGSGWVRGGVRPQGRPAVRIRQASAIHFQIERTEFRLFLRCGLTVWEEIIAGIPPSLRVGAGREKVVRQTVFIPGVWLLGDLFASNRLKKEAVKAWNETKMKIPRKILHEFSKAGFVLNDIKNRPGVAHQYKRYCAEGRCTECEVFKSVIHS